jgi:hypothetical protein
MGFFLFATTSRLSLGPIQPPNQWVLGCLTLGVNQLALEADHSSTSSAEVKNARSYTSAHSVYLHGMVLN